MFKTLTRLYGNKTGQRFLERIVRRSLLYMGVGSGENVHESGEAGVLHKLKALDASPYCIFDVGAHQGQYLGLALAVMAEEDFHIHCFEPSPRVFGALADIAKDDPRVTANHFGLGRQRGERDLFQYRRVRGDL